MKSTRIEELGVPHLQWTTSGKDCPKHEKLNDFVNKTKGECTKPSVAEVCATQKNLLQLLNNMDIH